MMHRTMGAVVFAAFLLPVSAPAQEPPPPQPDANQAPTGPPPGAAPEESPSTATDPGATAAGALAFFMNSRDYRTLRELKSILTPSAQATYDHDSVAYNGKKGIRLAAFDYHEPAPKPTTIAFAA